MARSFFSKSLAILLIAVVPAALFVYLGYVSSSRQGGGANSTTTLIRRGGVSLAHASDVRILAETLAKGTRFQGKINTEGYPVESDLNIYMLNPQGVAMAPLIRCNCAYIGHRVILCDEKFIESFAGVVRFSQDLSVLKKVNDSFRLTLMSWLLGHEIGHAVLHDRDGRYAYDVLSEVGKLPSERTADWKRREDEADQFAISHLPQADLQHTSFALMNLIFQIYSRAYQTQHPPGTLAGKFVYIRSVSDGIHDPWVLRALHLAHAVEMRSDPDNSKTDMANDLLSMLIVTKDGYDVGSLCDGVSIRR